MQNLENIGVTGGLRARCVPFWNWAGVIDLFSQTILGRMGRGTIASPRHRLA